ncbi:hypothetical protein AV530_018409 [Patagioenas fasciata monilis]|uniref:Uncharacterized protein n=1 Tax=Patagioenas fasciata monilis TaxID=372326 RepID=A0A1V4JT68_PATFA|nr:hypothetical protein AV530_018409 [Patagioenas fasciata monilis]
MPGGTLVASGPGLVCGAGVGALPASGRYEGDTRRLLLTRLCSEGRAQVLCGVKTWKSSRHHASNKSEGENSIILLGQSGALFATMSPQLLVAVLLVAALWRREAPSLGFFHNMRGHPHSFAEVKRKITEVNSEVAGTVKDIWVVVCPRATQTPLWQVSPCRTLPTVTRTPRSICCSTVGQVPLWSCDAGPAPWQPRWPAPEPAPEPAPCPTVGHLFGASWAEHLSTMTGRALSHQFFSCELGRLQPELQQDPPHENVCKTRTSGKISKCVT